MRILYFDIDGTILCSDNGEVKEHLRDGALELAVRRAGFTQLVCVGNIGIVANAVVEQGIDFEALEVVFRICGGAFQDISWFRAVTGMVTDPEKRAEFIDFSSDWWYMDDLADIYLRKAGLKENVMEADSHRVLVPDPGGNGSEVLDWLNAMPV